MRREHVKFQETDLDDGVCLVLSGGAVFVPPEHVLCRNVAQRKKSRYPEVSRFLVQELLWRADHVQACDVFVHALIDDRGDSHR